MPAHARLLREARLLSQLDHPNICRIHEFVAGDDGDYLVLELIRGKDLRQALDEGLGPALRLPIALQVARTLVAAHAKGIAHRDLKPANVMLTSDDPTDPGLVKVLDFGIARSLGGQRAGEQPGDQALPGGSDAGLSAYVQTEHGSVLGTASYMSPEQARGEPATAASDMYSFGLLLQELFTGLPPYEPGLPYHELLHRAAEGNTLPVSGVEGGLTALIERLKSRLPEARPSAAEAAERLRWIADKPKRRRRRRLAAAVAAVLALGGLKYTFDLRRERNLAVEAREAAEKARAEAEQAREEAEQVTEFLEGLFKVSDPRQAQGEEITAREILDRGAQRLGRELAGQPRIKVRLLETVGGVYRQMGLYDASRPLLEAALKQRRELFGDDHEQTARSLRALAHLDSESGRPEAAEAPLERALAIHEHVLGEDHPEVAETLRVLAIALFNQGRLEEMAPLFRRAHRVLSASLPPEHPRAIEALGNLGLSHAALDEFEAAKIHFQRALDLGEEHLGPDHPDVLMLLNNLAAVHGLEEDLPRGAALLERLIPRMARVQGPDHYRTLRARSGLAGTYARQGETSRARELATESLEMIERALGPDHWLAVSGSSILAEVAFLRGEFDQAEVLYRRAHERSAAMAPASANTMALTHQLADLALLQSNLDRAEKLAESLLALAPEDSPAPASVLDGRLVLAEVAYQRGDLERAERLCREVLAGIERLAPRTAVPTDTGLLYTWARARRVLGEASAAGGDLEAAQASWEPVVEPMAQRPHSVYALQYRAMVLLRLGRIDEARPIARAALRGFRHPELIELCEHYDIAVPELR